MIFNAFDDDYSFLIINKEDYNKKNAINTNLLTALLKLIANYELRITFL